MKVDDASVAAPAGSLQEEDDFTTALYRAAIGPIGTAYYLPNFSRFEAAGRAGLGWNWTASLLTLNWLIFRQLWAHALAYVGALTAALLGVFGLGRLAFQMPQEMEVALLLMLGVFAFGIPGLFGNAWFYSHCQARIAQNLAAHTEVPAACTALNAMASKRPRAIGLAVANGLFIALLVGLYVEFSAYTPAHPMLPTTSGVVPAAGAMGTSGLQSASGLVGAVPAGVASAPAIVQAITPSAPAISASAPAAAPAFVASGPLPSASGPARASSAPAATPAGGASVPTLPTLQAVSQPASQPALPAIKPASAPAAITVSKPASAPVVNATTPTKAPVSKASEVKTTTATPPAAKSPEAKESTTKVPATKPSVSKSPASVPATSRDTYLINVGLFAQEQNANAAYAKLMEAGLPATIQPFSTSKGPRIRVRVGPFASQSQAEASAANVQALGLDAIVFKP